MPHKNPEAKKEYHHRYYLVHSEKLKNRSKSQYWSDPERSRLKARETDKANPDKSRKENLKFNHKISIEKYNLMLKEQDGKCLCGRVETVIDHRTKKPRALSVDHDHKCCPGNRSCGKCVRGLLCQSCNMGLGKFHDDPELLEKFAAYLRRARGEQDIQTNSQ